MVFRDALLWALNSLHALFDMFPNYVILASVKKIAPYRLPFARLCVLHNI